MHKGILVKCINPTKFPQISSFCEEWKNPSTLSPILSLTLKTMETNTKNTPSLLPLGSKHTLKLKFQSARCLEDLSPKDQGICEFLTSLKVVFDTSYLLTKEYLPSSLKTYTGTPHFLPL